MKISWTLLFLFWVTASPATFPFPFFNVTKKLKREQLRWEYDKQRRASGTLKELQMALFHAKFAVVISFQRDKNFDSILVFGRTISLIKSCPNELKIFMQLELMKL